jgi:hypothetical protein
MDKSMIDELWMGDNRIRYNGLAKSRDYFISFLSMGCAGTWCYKESGMPSFT